MGARKRLIVVRGFEPNLPSIRLMNHAHCSLKIKITIQFRVGQPEKKLVAGTGKRARREIQSLFRGVESTTNGDLKCSLTSRTQFCHLCKKKKEAIVKQSENKWVARRTSYRGKEMKK